MDRLGVVYVGHLHLVCHGSVSEHSAWHQVSTEAPPHTLPYQTHRNASLSCQVL